MESDISRINREVNIQFCKTAIETGQGSLVFYNKEIQELNKTKTKYNIKEYNKKIKSLKEGIECTKYSIQSSTNYLNKFMEEDEKRKLERSNSEFKML